MTKSPLREIFTGKIAFKALDAAADTTYAIANELVNNSDCDVDEERLTNMLLKLVTAELYELFIAHKIEEKVLDAWRKEHRGRTFLDPEVKLRAFFVQEVFAMIFSVLACARLCDLKDGLELVLTSIPLNAAYAFEALRCFVGDNASDRKKVEQSKAVMRQLFASLPPVDGDSTKEIMRKWCKQDEATRGAYLFKLFPVVDSEAGDKASKVFAGVAPIYPSLMKKWVII